MRRSSRPAATMLFDGDCRFCRRWVGRWRRLTGGRVKYAPYQEALASYPQVSAQRCAQAVQLIMPDGSVLSGARAAFQALALGGRYRLLSRLYDGLPLFGRVSELAYRLAARCRGLFSGLGR